MNARLVLVLTLVLVSCGHGSTPNEKQDSGAPPPTADPICQLLEGLTENRTVINVCATVEEVADIANTIIRLFPSRKLGASPDGGAACTPLPKTSVCATREELGPAIQALVAKRRAALLRDQ